MLIIDINTDTITHFTGSGYAPARGYFSPHIFTLTISGLNVYNNIQDIQNTRLVDIKYDENINNVDVITI